MGLISVTRTKYKTGLTLAGLLLAILLVGISVPSAANAAKCSGNMQYHGIPVQPGKLVNPYHRRLKPNSFVPMVYTVAQRGSAGRTIEARLSPVKSLSACKKKIRRCISKKSAKTLRVTSIA